MSLESALSIPSVPSAFFDPFALWGNNPIVNMAQMFMANAREMTSAISAPYDISVALEAAKAEERRPTRTVRGNTATDLGITSITIKGKQWDVDTAFEQISDTCVMWTLSCGANTNQRVMGIVAPYSGKKASSMKHVAEALLPNRNIVVLGWVDPRELPENTEFTVDRQAQDVSEFFIRLGTDYSSGFDAIGISQSGIAVTEAIARLERNGTHLDCQPGKVILAGVPMDVSVGRTPIEAWLHNLPSALQENMLINIGGTLKGRSIFPAAVMDAASKHVDTGITYPFENQDIDGGHWRNMMEIFRVNGMASLRLKYTGGILTVAAKGDVVVPEEQTKAAEKQFPHVPADRKRHRTVEKNHFDLIQPGKPMQDMIAAINEFTLG